jgi:hypothetical protein
LNLPFANPNQQPAKYAGVSFVSYKDKKHYVTWARAKPEDETKFWYNLRDVATDKPVAMVEESELSPWVLQPAKYAGVSFVSYKNKKHHVTWARAKPEDKTKFWYNLRDVATDLPVACVEESELSPWVG